MLTNDDIFLLTQPCGGQAAGAQLGTGAILFSPHLRQLLGIRLYLSSGLGKLCFQLLDLANRRTGGCGESRCLGSLRVGSHSSLLLGLALSSKVT